MFAGSCVECLKTFLEGASAEGLPAARTLPGPMTSEGADYTSEPAFKPNSNASITRL